MSDQPLFAGIEAGGTKFNCVVGAGPDDVRCRERVPTTDPATTLAACTAFFERARRDFGPLRALGIASFGPVDLDTASPTYGYITSTTKRQWINTDIAGHLQRALEIPVGFDTDVNGSALGEWHCGAGRDLHSFVYVTVGTGIGGGAVVDDRLVHGAMHPEIGHMLMPQPAGETFEGVCDYHGTCLEGLASGPAIQARWGCAAQALPPEHPAWVLQAHYLACLCLNVSLCFSPQRIILGGGVMEQAQLLPLTRRRFFEQLNGYLAWPRIGELDDYIVTPALGSHSGEAGALILASEAAARA